MVRLLESMSDLAEDAPFVFRLLHEFAAEKNHLDGKPDQGQDPGVINEDGKHILTRRELDVLQLLAERLRDKQIASQLFISTETVKTHLKNIFQKLDVHNRDQAVVEAKKLNILE